MRANALATEARDEYRKRPYSGRAPDYGFMSGGFGRTRDSDPLEISNHRTAVERYKAAGVAARVDGFKHWAVGWVDEITVPITSAAIRVLRELHEAVDSYPVLDDEDFSAEEWEDDHPGDRRCYSSSEIYYGEPCPCGLPKS